MAAHRAAITRRTRRSSPEGRARTNLRLVQCAEGGGDVFDHLRFGALDGEGRDPQGGEQAEPGAEEEVLLAEALLEHVDGRADAAGGGAGRGEDVGDQLEAVLGDGTVEGELGAETGGDDGPVGDASGEAWQGERVGKRGVRL